MTWRCGSCAGANPEGTRFCGNCGAPASSTSGAAAVAARLPEQRRLVTALFADLSGFTGLSEQLDPETLSEIIGEVIRVLSEVVDRYGGTVLNYAGDAVLAGFGVPEAAGDDAERAMATALDMRAALAALLPTLPAIAANLTLHIGINSGHAVARYTGASGHISYTLIGDAVNTAQRLEAAAPSDEIYIGQTTAELAGRRFVLEPVGLLKMKGKAAQMPAWRLIARNDEAVRSRPTVSTFVGRGNVVSALTGLSTRSGVVALVGEPGIGKTAAVQDVIRRSTDAGATCRWVMASAPPYDTAPYGVWRSLARQLSPAEDVIASIIDDSSSAGSGAIPESSVRRIALHRAVTLAIRQAAPIVVVVDDLQWADPASIDLVREFAYEIGPGASSPQDASVSLVVTARPEAVALAQSLVDEASAGSGELIVLDGLATEQIGGLITGVLGQRPSDELVTLISERTGGSPFFATELVALLRDQGRLKLTDGVWHLMASEDSPPVPPSVEELVLGRLDKLDPGSRATMELASVIGLHPSVALLHAASGGKSNTATLERLVGAGLLVRDPSDRHRLSFRHGIVRDVAYRCTLRHTRRSLHRQVADAIETLPTGADPERLSTLAMHLFEADAGLDAVRALNLAAEQATRVFANQSAAQLLSKAIEVGQRHGAARPGLDDMRSRLAELHESLAEYDVALTEYTALTRDSLVDATIRTDAVIGQARVLGRLGQFDESFEILDAVVDSATKDSPSMLVVRASNLLSAGRFEEAVSCASDGLASQPELADHLSLILTRAQASDALGRTAEAMSDAQEAIRLGDEGTDPLSAVRALRVLGGLYLDLDRLDDAQQTLQRGAEAAARGGAQLEHAMCLANLALVVQRTGDLKGAIALDRECVDRLHRIGSNQEAASLANLAHKLIDDGQLDAARSTSHQSHELADRVGDAFARADALYASGRIELACGNAEAASELLEQSLSAFRAIGATAMIVEVSARIATPLAL